MTLVQCYRVPLFVLDTIVPDGLCNALLLIRYPYPTSFYNPVPGYPFKVACEGMLKAGTPLGALRAAADVYYNYSGQAGPCFGSYRMGRRAATLRASRDHDEQDDGPPSGWGYQTCTEVYQPMPTNGGYPAAGGDMFTPYTPNKTAIYADCMARWGVEPREDWEEHHFWGPNIETGSNIFLSGGQVDPWSAAGIPTVNRNIAPDSIEIHENLLGAHHLDIRASNKLDPEVTPETISAAGPLDTQLCVLFSMHHPDLTRRACAARGRSLVSVGERVSRQAASGYHALDRELEGQHPSPYIWCGAVNQNQSFDPHGCRAAWPNI